MADPKAPDRMKLIPGGTFLMGSEHGYPEEKPVHEISVSPFYMDEYPVTNREYKEFCDATHRGYPGNPRWPDMPNYFLDYPDYPVINVDWGSAAAYAAFRGKRLPTEEEWEYAASGGQSGAIYPWGDAVPDGSQANFADRNSDLPWHDAQYNDGYKYTSPVGSYPPNAYGLYDMAGNVYEWVQDWFFSYADKKHDTSSFSDGWGGSKVCRGGCYHSIAKDLRIARRRTILGGGTNASVGFRCARDLVVEEKSAEPAKPAPRAKADPFSEKLDAMRVRIPDGQELCIGIGGADLKTLQHLKNMGVTSVEQYVTWESCENAGEGKWDFSHWDEQVRIIREAGLRWLPFIIAGPAYSLPDWYRASREFEGLVCCEHGTESRIQTFWDKNFYVWIDRFLKAFADHFSDTDVFEGLLFGICGDFGEAIVSVAHGNWPMAIPGVYHSHGGYWCGDRFARADFRKWAQDKFAGDIGALNACWGSDFPSFGAVTYPPLDITHAEFRVDECNGPGAYVPKDDAQSRRWIDFIDWYRKSMTDYASFWMQTGRKYFPSTELYLCTGGDAVPWHASEFAQQSKISAAVGGGVRITNEASNYAFNFAVTNWVASASTFYKGIFSFEPAGQVTERGLVVRVYNAAATGAKSLHYYGANIMGSEERATRFAENVHFLQEGGIERDIAVLYPDTPMMLDMRRQKAMYASFTVLRDYTDYAYACDQTIADGMLDGIRALIIPVGGPYKTATMQAIDRFAKAGGLLVGINLSELYDLDTHTDYLDLWFGPDRKVASVLVGGTVGGKVSETGTSSNYKMEASTPEQIAQTQKTVFDPVTRFLAEHGVFVADGKLDKVFTARRNGKLLILNDSGADITRDFTRADGTSVSLTVPDISILEA